MTTIEAPPKICILDASSDSSGVKKLIHKSAVYDGCHIKNTGFSQPSGAHILVVESYQSDSFSIGLLSKQMVISYSEVISFV